MGAPVFIRSLDWMLTMPVFPHAECVGAGVDPDLWFADTRDHLRQEDARAICGDCRHRIECAEYAISNGIKDGIFGGLDPDERRRLKRRRSR
jgi:WhiB family redox-sensing transcriptional regulator